MKKFIRLKIQKSIADKFFFYDNGSDNLFVETKKWISLKKIKCVVKHFTNECFSTYFKSINYDFKVFALNNQMLSKNFLQLEFLYNRLLITNKQSVKQYSQFSYTAFI